MNPPAFLNELSPDANLSMVILNQTVRGKDAITKIITTAAGFYESMTPLYKGGFDGHEFIVFTATLLSGEVLQGQVTMDRGADGLISQVNVSHLPLHGLLALSKQVGQVLASEFGADLFA
jgi:hypothetical protein